ncbi:MAG: hypothetical protein LIP12_07130, partial [Clostridiales bacterium]|nr:hypothetical protein [Clostridiales bacterium]
VGKYKYFYCEKFLFFSAAYSFVNFRKVFRSFVDPVHKNSNAVYTDPSCTYKTRYAKICGFKNMFKLNE